MNTYKLQGVLFPPNVLNLDNFAYKREISGLDNSLKGDLSLVIRKSEVVVVFETIHNFDSSIGTLATSLEYVCQLIIDSYNFYEGTSVVIYFVFGGNMNGELGLISTNLSFIYNQRLNRPFKPEELIELGFENGSFRRVLDHSTKAIHYPFDVGLHCFRAIETIRKTFLGGYEDTGAHRTRSWIDMRQALSLSQDDINIVKKHSDITRHGGIVSVSFENNLNILSITWKVIDKYIVYLKQNN